VEEDGWRIISSHGQWQIVSARTNQSTPLYDGMHRLICKLAWQYSKGTSLSVQDLISEGYLALLLANNKYDPERGAKSTFVYHVVRNHFVGLRGCWPLMLEVPDAMVSVDPASMLEDAHRFRQAISSLSAEAKEVVKIICESPKEIMDIAKTGTPERLHNAVIKLLRRARTNNWTREYIQSLIAEIKITIQKL
jgi:DNA-directed RNA polymerase specialized sigma24 family protein